LKLRCRDVKKPGQTIRKKPVLSGREQKETAASSKGDK
jgi:hypothetical protein